MPNHIHPPVATISVFGQVVATFGCGFFGHDPACAAMGAEVRCVEILQGKNKGNYHCTHNRIAVAKRTTKKKSGTALAATAPRVRKPAQPPPA